MFCVTTPVRDYGKLIQYVRSLINARIDVFPLFSHSNLHLRVMYIYGKLTKKIMEVSGLIQDALDTYFRKRRMLCHKY